MQSNKFASIISDIDNNYILEHMPGYIYWKDLNFRYVFANESIIKSLGFSNGDDIIGKTDYDFGWDKSTVDQYRKLDEKILKFGQAVYNIEETVITKDGQQLQLLVNKVPVRNKSGEIVGILGINIDIGDKKEAERLKLENIKLEAENRLTQVLLEKLVAETEAEQLRLENEAYLAQKKEQAKFLAFIDKIQRDIQNYKVEALTEQIGIKPKISNSDKQIRLTKRELDVIYYLSLNKSPKEISQIITIIENKPVSDSTINAIINKKLYPKFEVFNIGQLVEKAILLNQIPFLLVNSSD
jgi:PAS domain S-box-containing protein